MRILFAASEAAPFFKTGGLGDVAGALPKELVRKGEDVRVVLPLWSKMKEEYKNQLVDLFHFDVYVGYRRQYCGVKELKLNGVHYYFIDNMYYFDRDGLYGYYDDGERFAFFQMAIIEMMEKVHFIPDLIHVNDYHTAFIPFLLKEKYRWIQAFNNIRTVLTIHNIEFQGMYNKSILWELYGMGAERYDDGTVVWDNNLNMLKAGILYADRVNTVSPSYANEIQTAEFGSGLDQVLRMENGKLSGILNGIDYDSNNPEADPMIEHHFSANDLSGKAKNKAEVQKMMGLPVKKNVPLIAMVSRLTYQKGFHLVLQELHSLLQQDVQLVLLGTGDTKFEEGFRYFAQRYPEKISVSISFNVKMAQMFYAGADLFLMPSAFEPCGLSQMMAMRYGTLPIVHEIGGLKDSVIPFNKMTNEGTGFGFQEFQGFVLRETIEQAIEVFAKQKTAWAKLQKNAMTSDFSWDTQSEQYLELYRGLLG
ncbi:starch synthase [Pilibacter termitis]|uniref:Glycogen synthase n=1 Tax=Pilibacter termitis TaxID=263852 RepID=A0A1T4NR48_9ENTE|nr:glycogen synthase GlgA [Pilibacter termitis]SJZ81567.1 starch synthase [Pilibacter termitis]